MRRFKTFATINEASVMKSDYVAGHKVVFNGKGFKELLQLGYKKGDIFELVGPGQKVALSVGKEDAPNEKFLLGPDGKIIRMKGADGFKSSSFTHDKGAGGMPSGAEWEDLIVYAYNNLKGQSTDPETEEVALKYWDNVRGQRE